MFHLRDLIPHSLVIAGLIASAPLSAHEFKAGDLVIDHPWTKVPPVGARTGAGYLKISNKGASSDRLVGAAFGAAQTTEVHEMTMVNDVMRMRQIPGGIEIKAGEAVELKPGGLHLMLIGLKEPITEGALLKGSLTFEKAGTVAIELKVEAAGAKAGHDHGMTGHGAKAKGH